MTDSQKADELRPPWGARVVLWLCCLIGDHSWRTVDSITLHDETRIERQECAECGTRRRHVTFWENRND